MHFPNWIKNNIVKVKQILTNGTWKKIDSICIHFKKRELLSTFELAKLKNAFPKLWFDKLRNSARNVNTLSLESNAIEISTGDCIDISVMKARHYYHLMIEKEKRDLPCIYFWNAYFTLPLDFNWKALLEFKLDFINDNRIKQYNFKFIHRILPSKDNLCKWKIQNDILCNTCKVPETTIHILFTCKVVTLFWKIVSKLIDALFDVKIVLNEKLILIGHEIEKPEMNVVNLILNLAQFVIYRNYIRKCFGNEKHKTHALYFIKELKLEIRIYLKRKYNQKRLDLKQVSKVLSTL